MSDIKNIITNYNLVIINQRKIFEENILKPLLKLQKLSGDYIE